MVRAIDPLPFRVAQRQRDTLRVGDFVRRAEPRFLKKIETGASCDSARLPAHDHIAGVLGSPPCGHLPQLALFVVDEAARRPGQQRRQDVSDTFAAARRGNDDAVLRPVVSEVMGAPSGIRPTADINTGARATTMRQQAIPADLEFGLEARGSMHAFMPDRAPPAGGRYAHDRQHAERRYCHQRGVDNPKCCLRVGRPRRLLPLHPGPRRIEMSDPGST
jgi:hypothetical protein